MWQTANRNIALSLPRRFAVDFLYFSRKVPAVTVDRRMNLAAVVAARQQASPRPAWSAIFAKGFALVASRRPELRRAYLPLPWPRLYEHGNNVAAIIVERPFEEESVPFPSHVRSPEARSLTELDAFVRACKEEPVEKIASHRRAVRLGRFPKPVRRLLWWLGLNVFARQRARFMGTFGVTSTGAFGAGVLQVLSPLTCTVHYSLFDAAGNIDVRLTFDHRVFDGRTAAHGLAELEGVLGQEILQELRSLSAAQAA